MTTMSISFFKAHALNVIKEVEETREKVVLTRRGKAAAILIPPEQTERGFKLGALKNSISFNDDIISATVPEDDWDALI
jgi:prevent-host-death family protein